MSHSARQLEALARIARIRSDMELKKFAAFRQHVASLDERIAGLQAELRANAEGAVAAWTEEDGAGSLRLARLAHALARSVTIEREAVQQERARLTPRFEQARSTAVRAFGRADVLDRVAADAARTRREERARRQSGD